MPGSSAEQCDLAVAFLCALPSLEQESDLGLAADKRRHVGAVQRLEAANDGARASPARPALNRRSL